MRTKKEDRHLITIKFFDFILRLYLPLIKLSALLKFDNHFETKHIRDLEIFTVHKRKDWDKACSLGERFDKDKQKFCR